MTETRGERGRTGDHGQRGETGATGDRGRSFSRTQVLVMFLFMVVAFTLLAVRSEHNADRIDKIEQRQVCTSDPAGCELKPR
jgi:hypothetical protein